jgi:hypothetical protein
VPGGTVDATVEASLGEVAEVALAV